MKRPRDLPRWILACSLLAACAAPDPAAVVAHQRWVMAAEDDPVLDGFAVDRVSGVATAFVVVSTPARRRIVVYEGAAASRADASPADASPADASPADASPADASPTDGAGDLDGWRPVLTVDIERERSAGMRPHPPRLVDFDGDGKPELLAGFESVLADRVATTCVVLRNVDGRWQACDPPGLLALVRGQFAEQGIRAGLHVDAPLTHGEVNGVRIRFDGLSRGGDWYPMPRAGNGAGLLAVGALAEPREAPQDDRVALAMFRLGEDGFEPDPSWNDGRLLVAARPDEGALGRLVASRWRR